MTFLPIVERELRVAARKVTTHRLWLIAAVCASAIFFILLVAMEGPSRLRHVGGQIFVAISILAFVFTLVAGVFLTADCLCTERKDGTLGLLSLTDLRGYDVVLGKLVATSIVACYTVLAVIPILGVPLLMGGVTGFEFGRTVLSLLTTLLLSLAVGMFASAVSSDTRAAMILSFGIILGLTGVLFLISFLLNEAFRSSNADWLLLPSPVLGFTRAFDGWYQSGYGASQFWASTVVMLGLSAGFLVFASFWLPRSWRDESKRPQTASRSSRVATRSTESLDPNPFAWLVGRDRFPSPFVWWVLGFLGLVCVGCAFAAIVNPSRNGGKFFSIAFLTAFGIHVIVKGLMAVQATRRLCDERQSGALELLLVTPLEPLQILNGQRNVLRRQFKPLLWGLTWINVGLIAVVCVLYPEELDGEIAPLFSLFFLGGIGLVWLDFHAVGWTGLWTALRGQRSHRATLSTILRVLLPPWLAILLFTASTVNRGISIEFVYGCWFAWMLLCITMSCMAAAKSKRELTRSFRQMAVGDTPTKHAGESRPWSPGWSSATASRLKSAVIQSDRQPTP